MLVVLWMCLVFGRAPDHVKELVWELWNVVQFFKVVTNVFPVAFDFVWGALAAFVLELDVHCV